MDQQIDYFATLLRMHRRSVVKSTGFDANLGANIPSEISNKDGSFALVSPMSAYFLWLLSACSAPRHRESRARGDARPMTCGPNSIFVLVELLLLLFEVELKLDNLLLSLPPWH